MSSYFKLFWTPAFAGVTLQETFYEIIKVWQRWIEEARLMGDRRREGKWEENTAVASESFMNATKEKLDIRAHGREVSGSDGSYALRGSPMPYKIILWQENDGVRPQNGYYWNDTAGMSAP